MHTINAYEFNFVTMNGREERTFFLENDDAELFQEQLLFEGKPYWTAVIRKVKISSNWDFFFGEEIMLQPTGNDKEKWKNELYYIDEAINFGRCEVN